MRVYKRYACHRVYDSFCHFFPQSVVTITKTGEVIGCTPLKHETSFTEWIGGVIVLSPLSYIVPYRNFHSLLCEMTSISQTPLYAWHISDFDFIKEELTPQSQLRRL
ncbi:MAG: hypothetical protein IJB61_08315 [Bacteroides sp]|nr:hypothetical protein [Bacteroides sp.]MBQ3191224.1 hypothetical protein [Bacteroides sp.]